MDKKQKISSIVPEIETRPSQHKKKHLNDDNKLGFPISPKLSPFSDFQTVQITKKVQSQQTFSEASTPVVRENGSREEVDLSPKMPLVLQEKPVFFPTQKPEELVLDLGSLYSSKKDEESKVNSKRNPSRQHDKSSVLYDYAMAKENKEVQSNIDQKEISSNDHQGQDLEANNIEGNISSPEPIVPNEAGVAPNEPLPLRDNNNEHNVNIANASMNNVSQVIINDDLYDQQIIQEPETKIYLCKVIGLLVGVIFASIYLLLVIYFQLTGLGMFAIILVFLIFRALVDMLWTLKVVGDSWVESHDVYKFYDTITYGITAGLLFLKLEGVLVTSKFMCLPFVVLTIVTLVSKKVETRDRTHLIILRALFSVQILLVTLRLDGNTDWKWKIVLMPSWICFWSIIFHALKFVYSVLKKIVQPNHPQTRNLSRATKIVGCLWFVMYRGLSGVAIAVFAGFSYAMTMPPSMTLLCSAGYAALIFSVLALIYTVCTIKYLTKFIINFELIESHLARLEASRPKNRGRVMSFEIEKKEQYFVMVSPTYFLALEKSFSSKDKASLKKMKSLAKELKRGKTISSVIKPQNRLDRSESIKLLRQAQDTIQNIVLKRINTKKPNHGQEDLNKSSLGLKTIEESQIEQEERFALSISHIDEIKKLKLYEAPAKENVEEGQCYVCCKNLPDAVFVDCGHGGICYGCATTSVEKKNTCIECRRKVEGIYRIDPNPKFSNIVKGIEVSRVRFRNI